MMRMLFLVSTTLFWAAVAALWALPAVLPGSDGADTARAADPSFTMAEVARHASADDCWMVIGGEVYDFTAYLPMHPSDPALLVPWCGKDATEAYRTKTLGRPHSAYADRLLPKYRRGQLAVTR